MLAVSSWWRWQPNCKPDCENKALGKTTWELRKTPPPHARGIAGFMGTVAVVTHKSPGVGKLGRTSRVLTDAHLHGSLYSLPLREGRLGDSLEGRPYLFIYIYVEGETTWVTVPCRVNLKCILEEER